MNLLEFKNYIEIFKQDTLFKYGISYPFSWRGSYDEVAFEVLGESMTKEEILKRIEYAYSKTFIGYKGGEFTFDDSTDINFESELRNWSNGSYTAEWIANLEGTVKINSQEERLIKLIFK